jgi:hypothetical protein
MRQDGIGVQQIRGDSYNPPLAATFSRGKLRTQEVISMGTSRVSRRLAIFVVAIGWAFRMTAADEPRPEPVAAVEQLLPPPPGEIKLQAGEPADVLLEIREHLGPSILEGTLFQNGNACAYAWFLGPDEHDAQFERSAFIEYIRALAAEKPVSRVACHEQHESHSAAGCESACSASGNAACVSCAHQAVLRSSQAHLQTAAAVSALRGAARQLEVTAGEIEDYAQGTSIETVELAWNRSDELREVARSLRDKANSTFEQEGSFSTQANLSHRSAGSCSAGRCQSTTVAETKAVASSQPCSSDCEYQAGRSQTASAECAGDEHPTISKLPYLGRLFENAGVAPCDAAPVRTFGVPVSPHRRLFTAVRIAPPSGSTGPAPTAAELEATIDQLAEELHELRSQLRAQTSRRVIADQSPE